MVNKYFFIDLFGVFRINVLSLQCRNNDTFAMSKNERKRLVILSSTLSRLPLYHCYLKDRQREGQHYVSATVIAQSLSLNSVLVRKDLASISRLPGKPRMGFSIAPLLADLEEYLGYNNLDEALIVGVGSLGRALLAYEAFEQYGLSIVVGFDSDEGLSGIRVGGKPVLPMSKLADMVRRLGIRIGIITVPKDQAQRVCDALVEAGIRAIWNFAPVHLDVPSGVLLKNENLAASLAALSNELQIAAKSLSA